MEFKIRIICLVSLIFSIMFLPWWCAFALGLGMAAYYPRCLELIGCALFFDMLYGMRGGDALIQPFMATFLAIVIIAVIEIVRPFILRMSR